MSAGSAIKDERARRLFDQASDMRQSWERTQHVQRTGLRTWQINLQQGGIGIPGPQGATGVDGLQGDEIPGNTGASGSVGQQGRQGGTGASGNIGQTGIAGGDSTGGTGASGSVGSTGHSGLGGDEGSVGATGSSGAKGSTGVAHVGGTGSTGSSGATGNVGGVGPVGSVGQKGQKGQKGDAGFPQNSSVRGIFHGFTAHQPGDYQFVPFGVLFNHPPIVTLGSDGVRGGSIQSTTSGFTVIAQYGYFPPYQASPTENWPALPTSFTVGASAYLAIGNPD